jgi:alpha-tubulin suppressor-like RCC1 family protein
VPGLTDIAEVSAGGYFTCARRRSGEVLCWGGNRSGQLGDGTYDERMGIVSTGIMDGAQISAGDSHACAIRLRGAVVCWGANDRGQLGDGTTDPSAVPRAVTGF